MRCRNLFAALALLLLAACNFNIDEVTPTVEGIEAPVNPLPQATEPTATTTPPITLSPTQTPVRILLDNPPLPTAVEAAQVATGTPTPGPDTYIVQSGDTLSAIASRYGYFDAAIINEIVRLNSLTSSESIRPGQQLLIPQRTAIPTAVGLEITLTVEAERGISRPALFAPGTEFGCHTIAEGDTPISIAEQYRTTLEILAQLNPAFGWTGCNFSNPSGGPDCRVRILRIDDCMQVPFPTPTPTLSPTPSGNETPTPTPTYAAPPLNSPPDGAGVRGLIDLNWVSAGVLRADEYYVVELTELDRQSGVPLADAEVILRATKDTSLKLPVEALPTAGQPRVFEWRVIVARGGEAGRFTRIGGEGRARRFTVNP